MGIDGREQSNRTTNTKKVVVASGTVSDCFCTCYQNGYHLWSRNVIETNSLFDYATNFDGLFRFVLGRGFAVEIAE